MKTSKSRGQKLVDVLQEACRRPLFTDIVLFEKRPEPCTHKTEIHLSPTSSGRIKGGKHSETREEKCWVELLAEAASISRFLTDQQHGEVMRLSSILLLGFLLPYSTGCDLALLQNAHRSSSNGAAFDPVRYVVEMPLEERLERSVREYSSYEFGEVNVILDASVELALDALLSEGFAPLLSSRPFHREQVDLLHMLALAIHPNPDLESMIPHTSRYLNSLNTEPWRKAQRLARGVPATQFQITYGTRHQLVKLVAEYLALPDLSDTSQDVVGPLLYGALPHLRASLQAFARGALALEHRHAAATALVSIAVQTKDRRIMEEEWHFLLHLMVEDRTKCLAVHGKPGDSTAPKGRFCIHKARGDLLSLLVSACFRAGSDKGTYLQQFGSSLTDAIEWQFDCWSQSDEDEGVEKKQLHPPCLLASLLGAATTLVTLLVKGVEETFHTALTETGLQLLRHPHQGIAHAAASLLVQSLQWNRKEDYMGALFSACKMILREDKGVPDLNGVVAVVSQRSMSFAASLLQFLIAEGGGNKLTSDLGPRLIATTSASCPTVAAKQLDALKNLLDQDSLVNAPLLAAILSARLSRFFAAGRTEEGLVRSHALRLKDRWEQYQLAGHALVTGNFELAEELYGKVSEAKAISEKNFFWISALKCMAKAEVALGKGRSRGIPDATIHLRSAISFMRAVNTSAISRTNEGMECQIKLLLLRLDFLDLITVLRQLTQEMRLTGNVPHKYTRSHLHVRNLVRGFVALSTRYRHFNQKHGMSFRSGRSCVRLLQATSLFMEMATRRVFSDVRPGLKDKATVKSMIEHMKHPLAEFMRRIDELVLVPMDESVDPQIRAAAMLEVIDGVLLIPIPFSKDFFSLQPRATATLFLSPEPEQSEDIDESIIDAYPSICFSFCCSGQVQESIRKKMSPSWTLVIWFRLVYSRPLEDDEPEEKQDEEIPLSTHGVIVNRLPDLSSVSPTYTPMLNDGKFFSTTLCPPLLDEGMFTLEVKLGCQDATGNQWEIPVDEAQRHMEIRVSRSR